MSASIEIPFAIGSVLWTPTSGPNEVTEVCPECCGSKYVTVTIGTGESFRVDCAVCERDWEPRGTVLVRQWESVPEKVTLMRFIEFQDGEARYGDRREGGHILGSNSLFTDKEACAARCAEINAKHAEAVRDQIINSRLGTRKKFAWSVSYWRNCVKRAEEEAQRYRERLDVCRAREAEKKGKK